MSPSPDPSSSSSSTVGARVELTRVGRVFKETGPVIENFDLRIEPGEFVSLLGPSGCGKSTLLRLIAGLDRPDRGEVRTEAFGKKFYRGFVFQDAHLLPWRSALDNVLLPLQLMKRSSSESMDLARSALEGVGLGDALHRYPSQLSGGMRMRVSVARALVAEPTLLLLDEPFSALDEQARFQLQEDLRALWEKMGMTVVFVTHSISEAVFLAERAVVLSANRPAHVLMDKKIGFTERRTAALRMNPEFVREVQGVTQAFPRGRSR